MTNNYDTNMKGIDIECNIQYDEYEARTDFKENFEAIDGTEWSYIYTDWGNLKGEIDLADVIDIKGSIKELRKFLKNEMGFYEPESFTKYEGINEILNGKICGSYINVDKISYNEIETFNNFLSNCKFDLKASLNPNYLILETRGYSQGDYAQIFIDKKALREATGFIFTKKNIESLQETIDSLFWDCPISGQIIINGTEIEYNDFCKDSYTWDKQEAITYILKEFKELDSELLKSELENTLPDRIEY